MLVKTVPLQVFIKYLFQSYTAVDILSTLHSVNSWSIIRAKQDVGKRSQASTELQGKQTER